MRLTGETICYAGICGTVMGVVETWGKRNRQNGQADRGVLQDFAQSRDRETSGKGAIEVFKDEWDQWGTL